MHQPQHLSVVGCGPLLALIIAVVVRWYLRYGLPYRDVEELLAERGIGVDHVTVYSTSHRPRRRSRLKGITQHGAAEIHEITVTA